jgi:hypothetical protein
VVKPFGENLGKASDTRYNWSSGPWILVNLWGDVELRGSVFGVGFFEASVKVGLFGLWQGVAVGTVCLKGSTAL